MSAFITQTYLIGGLYQSAEMIHQIATTGKCSYEDFKHIIMALKISKFQSIEETFGSTAHLHSGLRACKTYYSMQPSHDTAATIQINRYFAELFKLASYLRKNPNLLTKIGDKVAESTPDFAELDENIEQLIRHFATMYSEIISPNAPRILIRGTENHLKIEFNAQKVRTLLLAGLRIVLLWRECGGKQWHLFIRRKKILETCHQLLNNP